MTAVLPIEPLIDAVVLQWERADADPRHHAAYTTTLHDALVDMMAAEDSPGKLADSALVLSDILRRVADFRRRSAEWFARAS